MDLTPITTSVEAIKAATKHIKNILTLNKDAKILSDIVALQGLILDLHSNTIAMHAGYSDLFVEKEGLKAKLKKQNDWKGIKKEYKLKMVEKNQYIYVSKAKDPQHWLCPNCFEKKQKSILQMTAEGAFGQFYKCPNCDHSLALKSHRH